jgi:hypothetical protein
MCSKNSLFERKFEEKLFDRTIYHSLFLKWKKVLLHFSKTDTKSSNLNRNCSFTDENKRETATASLSEAPSWFSDYICKFRNNIENDLNK